MTLRAVQSPEGAISFSYVRVFAAPTPWLHPYADFNDDGAVNEADVIDFTSAFDARDVWADLDANGVLDQHDVMKFWAHFNDPEGFPG